MAKLLFHIGSPKTGSSAIQQALGYHKESLESKAIQLPDANFVTRDSSLNSGNGEWVANVCTGIWPIDTAKGQLTLTLLEAQMRQRQDTILSSENFYYSVESVLRQVAVHATQSYEEIGIVLYVRNPVDMCFSLWLQGVKRNFLSPVTLEDYADSFLFDPISVIARFQAAFHGLKVYVKNYDAIRSNLVHDFFQTVQDFFGIDLNQVLASTNTASKSPAASPIVNRSLYRSEVIYMQALTEFLAAKHIPEESIFEAKRVSSDMFLAWNNTPDIAVCPEHVAKKIATQAQRMVQIVNDTYDIALTTIQQSVQKAEPSTISDDLLRAMSQIAGHALSRIPPSFPVVYLREDSQLEFEGYVDHASSVYVSGWVVCTTLDSAAVLVLVTVGDFNVTLVANILRADVASTKQGYSPYCGFYYEFHGAAAALISKGEAIIVSVLGSKIPLASAFVQARNFS